jgi:hypothetical protein
MSRYVLRYQGIGKPADRDLSHIRGIPGLTIVDASSPTLLLVEASDEGVHQLENMPTWLVLPETFVPVPDTRKKIHQSS